MGDEKGISQFDIDTEIENLTVFENAISESLKKVTSAINDVGAYLKSGGYVALKSKYDSLSRSYSSSVKMLSDLRYKLENRKEEYILEDKKIASYLESK